MLFTNIVSCYISVKSQRFDVTDFESNECGRRVPPLRHGGEGEDDGTPQELRRRGYAFELCTPTLLWSRQPETRRLGTTLTEPKAPPSGHHPSALLLNPTSNHHTSGSSARRQVVGIKLAALPRGERGRRLFPKAAVGFFVYGAGGPCAWLHAKNTWARRGGGAGDIAPRGRVDDRRSVPGLDGAPHAELELAAPH